MRVSSWGGLAALVGLLVVSVARAAPPETVPEVCRAQVEGAIRALEQVLARPGRRIPRGSHGTIEEAIRAYAPPRFHAVEEGALPPRREGGACPTEMANIRHRFCIDRWEGSLVEKLPDGTSRPHSPYEPPEGPNGYVAESVSGVVPQAYVSAAQAQAACHAAGKRLCSAVEWRAACGGSEGYAFPYGPERRAGACHDAGRAPMMVFHAATMKRGWGKTELNDPRNNQLDGTIAKTGAFPDCATDEGVYDMVGNLHEWTADPHGTFQGGYWLDTSQHGQGCAYRTIAHGYEYHDYSTGFRCCADAGAGPP